MREGVQAIAAALAAKSPVAAYGTKRTCLHARWAHASAVFHINVARSGKRFPLLSSSDPRMPSDVLSRCPRTHICLPADPWSHLMSEKYSACVLICGAHCCGHLHIYCYYLQGAHSGGWPPRGGAVEQCAAGVTGSAGSILRAAAEAESAILQAVVYVGSMLWKNVCQTWRFAGVENRDVFRSRNSDYRAEEMSTMRIVHCTSL